MPLFLIILLVIMILPIKFTVENILVLVNFILPSNIKRKYQNSSFYLNIIKDKKSLLTSKKLSDNFKLKLINKKLLKRLSTEDILNIISNLKKDESTFNILTNINIFKNTHTTSEKINFKNPMYYEKLYNFINENDKVNYLTHIKNDEFVIEKYNHLKRKLNEKNKYKIISSLESDSNKLLLINDVKSEEFIYKILSTFKDFTNIENYLICAPLDYQIFLIRHMSKDNINKFLEKNILVKPILVVTNDKDIFTKYFNELSNEDKIFILKNNIYSDIVLKYYKIIKNNISEKDSLEILVNIYKLSDEKTKKEIFNLLPSSLIKEIFISNKKVNLCDNKPAMYENIDKSISFGLELEASFDEGELIKKVRKINKTWSIKGDSSIENGVEIVSPILHYTQNDLANLKYICDFMENNDFKVTNECGGHIHIGFNYFSNAKELEMLYMIYTNTQDIFFDICNKKGSIHRPKLEYYAKPISNRLYLAISLHKFNEDEKLNDFVKEIKEIQDNRYFDINLKNAQSKLKNTIEFRFPNGEINYDEVLLNVTLIIKLCMAAKKYAYINEYDEKYLPVKLLQSDINKDARKNILLKMLFEKDKNLINLYNQRYESNNNEDVFTRKYVINFNGKKC